MKKSAKSKDGRKAARGQLWLHLPGMVREALYDTVIGAGLACVDEVLERERVALCGERYEHLSDRQALRAGYVASSLVLVDGGRGTAAAGAQCGGSRAWVAELAGMERTRSVGAARRGTDGAGSVDPRLRALVGAIAGSGRGTEHQQECGQRAVRLWHRAQTGRTDEPRSAPAPRGRAADRRGALRRACGAGGSRGR